MELLVSVLLRYVLTGEDWRRQCDTRIQEVATELENRTRRGGGSEGFCFNECNTCLRSWAVFMTRYERYGSSPVGKLGSA